MEEPGVRKKIANQGNDMELKNGKTHSKTELQPKMKNIIKRARPHYCWIGFVGCMAWILITGAVANGEGQSPSKPYPVSMSSTQVESEVTQTLKELNNPDIESQFRIGLIEKCMENIQSIPEDEFEERLKIMKLLFSLNPKLIESIVRPNERTPLHFAVEEKFENGKQLELIQFLIEHNANVNALDARGNTPLHLAVLFNPSSPELISIIRLLIENNADPNILDTYGQTFLCTASEKVGPKIFHEIFSYFVMRPNAKMSNIMNMQGNLGSTVLHEAVFHFELLNETLQLINDLNLDLNAVDKEGNTIFHYAIWGGRDVSFLKTLIRYGADWGIDNDYEANSLHWAAGYGNLHAIKLLIDLGIDVNAVNIAGDTALSSLFDASETPPSNTLELVQELLNYGANVNIVNTCGKSAVEDAQCKVEIGEIDQSVVDFMVKASKRTISEL